jgi:hypothetical protein
VQQSAYALLGDCSKFVFAQLKPFLPSIMPILLKRLDLENILDEEIDGSFSVVNNACWSAGEIAVQYKKDMAQFVPELLQRCVEIISNPGVPPGVNENAAIALGRLGLDNHELLAPHLAKFSEEFLRAMEEIDPSEEKATAFKGFGMVVAQNPQAMEKDLLRFFAAIARYRDLKLQNPVKQELHEVLQNVSCLCHLVAVARGLLANGCDTNRFSTSIAKSSPSSTTLLPSSSLRTSSPSRLPMPSDLLSLI